jgi:hypothetical protein
MKQVWTINEAGKRPVHFYTSRKKAIKQGEDVCTGKRWFHSRNKA